MIGRLLFVLAAVLGLAMPVVCGANVPDSMKLEKELQSSSWPGFRSVVEALPKLRAEVDRYGPLGWQYVRANYRTHPWKKVIDRLDTDQRRQLADLIQKAKGTGSAKSRAPAGG